MPRKPSFSTGVAIDSPTACSIIGLSFFWLLFRRPFYSVLLYADASRAFHSMACHQFFIVATVLIAVLFLGMHGLIEGLLVKRARELVAACGLPIVCMTLPSFLTSGASYPFAYVSMAVLAVSFAVLACMWCSVSCTLPARTLLTICVVSFLGTCAISTAFLLPQPMPFLLAACTPAISAVCWMRSSKAWGASRNGKGLRDALRGGLSKAVGILILFLLLSGVLRGLLYGGSAGLLSLSDTLKPSAIAFGLASCVLIVILGSSERRPVFEYVWKGLTALFFLGLFLLVFMDEDQGVAGRSIVIASRTCLNVFLFVCLAMRAQERCISAVVAGMVFLLVDAASSFLSYGVVPMAASLLPDAVEVYVAPCAAAVSFILMFVSFNVLGSCMFENRAESCDSMAIRDRFEERLDSLAKRYGLTEREKDITKLIAQGNTVKKTAALLYVSPGTVQSHMKNIYRKLDVHSRQEVIDMCRQYDRTVS